MTRTIPVYIYKNGKRQYRFASFSTLEKAKKFTKYYNQVHDNLYAVVGSRDTNEPH